MRSEEIRDIRLGLALASTTILAANRPFQIGVPLLCSRALFRWGRPPCGTRYGQTNRTAIFGRHLGKNRKYICKRLFLLWKWMKPSTTTTEAQP